MVFPWAVLLALLGSFPQPCGGITIGLVLFGGKYIASTAVVWAWLKRISFTGTDF